MDQQYYGVSPSSDFFAHYGIRGMKWGIRKAIEKKGTSGRGKSQAYRDAEKKLMRAGLAGGLIGTIGYAATHRNEMKALNSGSGKKKSSKAVHQTAKKKTEPLSASSKKFLEGYKKQTKTARLLGGALGGGASMIKYAKAHPKQYAAYKKNLKNMSAKDRIKTSFKYYY